MTYTICCVWADTALVKIIAENFNASTLKFEICDEESKKLVKLGRIVHRPGHNTWTADVTLIARLDRDLVRY